MSGVEHKSLIHRLEGQVADLTYHVQCGVRGRDDDDREHLARNRTELHRRKLQLRQAIDVYAQSRPLFPLH